MATVPLSNLSIGQVTAPLYTDVALAGLKADLMYDSTVALLYKQTDVITPGLVLHQLPDGSGALPSVTSTPASVPYGIFVRDALLDHAPTPFYYPASAPASGVALSIMQRGRIWAQVTTAGTCTAGGPVKYGADGTVSDTGANTLPHAIFKTVATPRSDGSYIVIVELHAPLAA